jgi:hypothetical protein
MDFISGMMKATNVNFTENGALSLDTSGHGVLDFFARSGALRGQVQETLNYFVGALGEDPELAIKALFYARDVRGGQGERDIFRNCLRYAANFYGERIKHLVRLIPEYGRWDDLYALVETPLEDEAFRVIKEQFARDMIKEARPSLLAKWLKSVNTSSQGSRILGRYTAQKLGMNEIKYRKALSKLRRKIDVVERKMTANQWSHIDYPKVPSQAMFRYQGAFRRNDPDRFADFMEKVKSGDVEIKAGTLYPYQIVSKFIDSFRNNNVVMEDRETIETYDEMWNALPNYMEGEETAIAVVDTSGSMTMSSNPSARPIDISVSLGIYFAERNKGPFKDHFITFSRRPRMQKVQGNNIAEKTVNLANADWDQNTDLIAVFETILETAKRNELSQEDIPNKVYIISDMQFDTAVISNDKTNFQVIDEMFEEAGYKRPDLVFWNVNAYSDIPVEQDENGTYLVSGASPSILKYAMNCDSYTPYDLMLETLNSDRYKPITL